VLLAAAAALAALPPLAHASITIGQVGNATASSCDAGSDLMEPTVPLGNPYVAPGVGTITSWAMSAVGPAGQQLTMKMYRKVADPLTYQAVGHAGPETLIPGSLNTFPASVRVKPGDVLGFHTVTDNSKCAFPATGATLLAASQDVADGGSAAFNTVSEDFSLNIQATFVPDNVFTGAPKVKRNRKKGTATITVNLPNPGELTGSGGGAKVATAITSKSVPAAGPAKLKVKAKGSKLRALSQSGKVVLKLKLTYVPTGGDPHTEKLKVKLLKR
jgi:hypothetical protein